MTLSDILKGYEYEQEMFGVPCYTKDGGGENEWDFYVLLNRGSLAPLLFLKHRTGDKLKFTGKSFDYGNTKLRIIKFDNWKERKKSRQYLEGRKEARFYNGEWKPYRCRFNWYVENSREKAVEVYGEGAEVYWPEDVPIPSQEKVLVKCPHHNTHSWHSRDIRHKVCPECKKDMGLANGEWGYTKRDWQKRCDLAHGEGEYDLYLFDDTKMNSKTEFPIWHKKCGLHFNSSLISLVTSEGGCSYCSSGKPFSTEQLQHKALQLGYPSNLTFLYEKNTSFKCGGSYHINVKCIRCDKEYNRVDREQFYRGTAGCLGCQPKKIYTEFNEEWSEEEKAMSPLHDIEHWIVFDKGYSKKNPTGYCTVHDHTFKSKAGCYICAGDKIRDEVSMREALHRNAAQGLDFSSTPYVKKQEYASFVCPVHGEQKAIRHFLMKGADCPACAAENHGWGRKGFYSSAKESHLYLVKIRHGGGYGEREFLKVGLAKTLNKRFARTRQEAKEDWGSDYLEIECLRVWKGPANALWQIESSLKWRSGISRIEIDMLFHGFTECFDLEKENDIVKYVEDNLTEDVEECSKSRGKIFRWCRDK